MSESTLAIIKPHAYEAGHYYAIVQILKQSGLEVPRHRIITPSQEVVEAHYAEHQDKSHFPATVASLCGRLAVLEISGPNAIARVRELLGATDPKEAAPGTIRQLFGRNLPHNAMHASSDECAARRELEFWFDRALVVDTEPWKVMEDIPRPTKP